MEKFTEVSDPIQDLGIGILQWPPKEKFRYLIEEFKKYGIKMSVKQAQDWGSGVWDLWFDVTKDFPLNKYDKGIDDVRGPLDVQCFYTSKKAAAKEGMQGGFELANSAGDHLMEITYDPRILVKVMVKRVYGSKIQIQKKNQKLQSDLAILKNVEQIL